MSEQNLHDLTASVSATALMAHCQEFARWVKLSGSAAELESFRYLQARLDEWGFRTRLISHDAYISLPLDARVDVDGQRLRAITHSHSQASPAAGISGPIFYLGEGRAADFAGRDVRGAIVLVEGIASPAVATLAREAGAIGQLHISPHHHLHEMCISPVWGSPSPETLPNLPSTVACTISNADGASLRDALDVGAKPHVTLHANVDTSWRKTPILEAQLDAPDGDGSHVLFSGHHDTWYYGVMDNGSANASMLEVARLIAPRRHELKRSLRICFWSGHSHGRYSGSAWYVDNHFEELDRDCAIHVNIDSTGGIGATILADAAAMGSLRGLAAAAIKTETGHGYHGKRKNRSSDESLVNMGVPSMFGALSEQPPGPAKMRNALGWWWHTPEDLLDKIDPDFLVRDTKVFVHVLWRCVTEALLPLDHTAVIDDLLAELGHFSDVDTLIASAETLREKLVRLAGSNDPARANAALMVASRALVPMDYADGERFVHDAALPVPAWAVLGPLRTLAAAAPGSAEAHFAEVAATRARNRLANALAQAHGALDVALG